MEEIQKRDQEPIDEQIIELYNSSALEILNRERKIITDRGDIDFQALDIFYRENRGSIAHLGGKSSLLMTAFCQMNSFNMASMNMIREEMKAYENDLAGILHHSVGTTENKFMVIANKINQMDTTTLNAVSELVSMIQADASKSAQVIKSTETQFSSVASHFSKVAL